MKVNVNYHAKGNENFLTKGQEERWRWRATSLGIWFSYTKGSDGSFAKEIGNFLIKVQEESGSEFSYKR